MEPLTPVPSGSVGNTILVELLDAIQNRRAVALATIVATDRSVPRRPGSKMLVFADGRTSGTIGGGEMEARVVAEALEALVSGKSRQLIYSLVDAAAGDPGVCGGTVELFLEPHMPQPTVYVIGVGHVGQAVVELALWLGYRVAAWDDRSDLAASVNTATTDVEILSGSIHEALETNPIDEHTMVVMTTRNVGLDVEILPPLQPADGEGGRDDLGTLRGEEARGFALGRTASVVTRRVPGENAWDIQVLLSGLEEEVPNNFRARLVIETGHPKEPRFESQIIGIRMPGRR